MSLKVTNPSNDLIETLEAFGDLHLTSDPALVGQAVYGLKDPSGNVIFLSQEASVGNGFDTKPAKVKSIFRVKGGWEITLQVYNYHKAHDNVKMGHQDWIIDWDTPTYEETFRIGLRGQLRNTNSYTIWTIGVARAYYNWEF